MIEGLLIIILVIDLEVKKENELTADYHRTSRIPLVRLF